MSDDFDAMFDPEDMDKGKPGDTPDEPNSDDPASEPDATAPETEAATDPAPEAKGEDAAKATEPEPDEPKEDDIPPSAFAAMRKDLNAKIDRLTEELRAEREQSRIRPQPSQSAPEQNAPAQSQTPDPILDPQGFHDYMMQEAEDRVLNHAFRSNLDRSYSQAVASGRSREELDGIGQAFMDAAKADPRLLEGARRSHDPFGFIEGWHRSAQAHQALAAHGGDLNAYVEAEIARRSAAQPVKTETPETPLPQSIVDTRPAAAPNARPSAPVDEFEAIFT